MTASACSRFKPASSSFCTMRSLSNGYSVGGVAVLTELDKNRLAGNNAKPGGRDSGCDDKSAARDMSSGANERAIGRIILWANRPVTDGHHDSLLCPRFVLHTAAGTAHHTLAHSTST